MSFFGFNTSSTEATSPPIMRQYTKKEKNAILLILIVLAGTIVHFLGGAWGLPVTLHPDERTIVETAIRMVKNKTFEPDVFYRPDHLLIQINMLVYSLISFDTPITELSANRPDLFYFVARIITGFFAIGSIFINYFIGKKNNEETGLICASLFAFFPIYATHSHYATPDIPTTFFMLLFILLSINYLKKPTYTSLSLMSLSTSAFIAIKYPGSILCIMIAITIILTSIRDKEYSRILKHGIISIIFILGFLFLISPVLFLNFDAVKDAFIKEARTTHLCSDGLGWFGNILYYFKNYLGASGILLFLFFIFECYTFIKKRKSFFELMPIFYSFIYGLCLSYMALHWERWALPMYVSPLLISGFGINSLFIYLKTNSVFKKHLRFSYSIYVTAIVLIFLNFFSGLSANLINFLVPDTRVISVPYCIENNITYENTAFEGYYNSIPYLSRQYY